MEISAPTGAGFRLVVSSGHSLLGPGRHFVLLVERSARLSLGDCFNTETPRLGERSTVTPWPVRNLLTSW
jgi:hypothetical protein